MMHSLNAVQISHGKLLKVNEFMKKTYVNAFLTILPHNAKSWATLIDFSYSSNNSFDLADLSSVESSWPLSFRRKFFQRKILKSKKFRLLKYRNYLVLNLYLYLKTFFAWRLFCNSLNTQIFVQKYNVYAILHCRISAYMGDRYFNRNETPLKVFRKHFNITFKTINYVEKLFKNNSYSNLVVYNGREPLAASAILIAKNYGSNILILERGSSSSQFQVFKVSPHFHPEWWELITSFNLEGEIDRNNPNIDEFLNNKLLGIDTYFGERWNEKDAKKRNSQVSLPRDYIAFFTSSSTEFSPFDEYNCTLGYSDQYEAVSALMRSCDKFQLPLVVRRHPNSIGADGVDREEKSWNLILSKFKNVLYLGPKIDINSYDIAKGAKSVYVWKSSIGFETLALDLPTYALGPAKWAWNPKVQVWNQSKIDESLLNPVCYKDLIVHQYARFMTLSGSHMSLFKEVQKWGVLTNDDKKIVNTIGERTRRKLYDLFLKLTKKSRKRNV